MVSFHKVSDRALSAQNSATPHKGGVASGTGTGVRVGKPRPRGGSRRV